MIFPAVGFDDRVMSGYYGTRKFVEKLIYSTSFCSSNHISHYRL